MKKTKTGDKSGTDHAKSSQNMWLIGMDEVGRGPLAGPVTVGATAVLIDGTAARTYSNLRKKLMEISVKINGGKVKEYPTGVDSKKMKESDRDFWYSVIRRVTKIVQVPDLIINVESKSAQDIDKKGIAACISELVDLNIKKILKKIQKNNKHEDASLDNLHVLLDGSLKTNLPVKSQKTIIKGDEKELAISLASVYAKVSRDAYMKKASRNPKYNKYGFEVHKGYGTLSHRQVILKSGLSDEHRRSFCNKLHQNSTK